MAVKGRPYLAFMLRLWQAGGDAGSVWRASLESPHSGERYAFADLAALAAFIEVATREATVPASAADGDGPASPSTQPPTP